MSQTELFRRLGASLANSRWSWGSVREADGTVFMRVWQDRVRRHEDRNFVQVTHNAEYAENIDNLGHQERQRHVELVRQGAPCYMVMCQAVDVNALPRSVKDFNSDEVFPGGRVIDLDGETWIELCQRVSVQQVRL